MAKWARIKNNKVWETFENDPSGRFPPSVEFRQCPDEVEPNMVYNPDTDEYTEFVYQITQADIDADNAARLEAQKVEAREKQLGIEPPDDNKRDDVVYS